MNTQLNRFRFVNILEGISYLSLAFYAMPLKYIYGDPSYIRPFGMAHGVLFIGFCLMLILASKEQNFSKKFQITAFISSLIPFGTLWLDFKLKKNKERET